MNRGAARLAVLLLAVQVSAIWTGCEEEKPERKPVVRPVRVVVVRTTEQGRQRTFSGVARAAVESRLSFRVAGTVKSIAVKVGDRVARGDRIAELDAKDFRLQVDQARASLSQARAQARNGKSTYDRTRKLYASRSASKSELDQARMASDTAKAAVRAAQKQLALVESQEGYTRLSAPQAGSIAELKIEINEHVKPGQPVLVLSAGDAIEVSVSVPEVMISQITKGLPVTVRFDALPDRTLAGRIEEVGVSPIQGGATYPVSVKLDQPEAGVRVGMAAEVTCQIGKADQGERLLVPAVAVGEDRKGRYVFVAKPGDPGLATVHRVEVEVGELTGDGLEIRNGLTAGDILVTAGLAYLKEGQRVRLPATVVAPKGK